MRIALVLIASVFFVVSCATTTEKPWVVEMSEIQNIEGITEYRLNNGLQVLLFPDPSQETVTVNVTYKVGSRHENYGETGMAHLLEHLLFKGSTNHPDITAEISNKGAKANGTTWIDRTNYYETFVASEENIDWALEMEADRMVNSFVAQEDLDSEMTVVRNEFERGENSPFRVLMQSVMSAAYMWHNNGKATIGARSDIENVSIERLRDFYRKYYQPDNAVLTVAGKFDQARVLEKIKNTFGLIPKPDRVLEPTYTEEPPQNGAKSVLVKRVGDVKHYLAAYHIPSGSHVDFAAIEVLSEILGDTPRGRLHKALVETQLAVNGFAYPFQLHEPGVLLLGTQTEKTADIEKARAAFLDVVEGIKEQPITEEEVARAKANIEKQVHLAFNDSQRIAIYLSEFIGMGDWRLLFLTRDRVEDVTVEDVQRVAEAYLQSNNRTEGTFIPTDEVQRVVVPQAPPLNDMLEGYEGKAGVSQGEAFDPSFENISNRTEMMVLPNGAKVSLLAKKTRGEAVVVSMDFNWGTAETLANKRVIGDMAASMLMRGSQKYSREAIQDKLDKLKASVNMGASPQGLGVSIETIKPNLPAVLDLVNEVLKNPIFEKDQLDQLKQASIANIEASRNMPQAVIRRELVKYLSPFKDKSHPGYQLSVDERIAAIEKVTVADMKAFHKRFYAGQNGYVAVVGDFDKQAVVGKIKSHFGDWQNKEVFKQIDKPFFDVEPKNAFFNTPDKENAAMMVGVNLPFGDENADAVAMELGTYIFGGGFLNSRLATRLRQKDGLSYGAGAWVTLSSVNDNGIFQGYAIFAPQNTAAVEQGFKEELQKVLADGFTEDEVKNAIDGFLQRSRINRSKDDALAGFLNNVAFLNRSFNWYQTEEEKIKALTKEDLHRVFKQYVAVDNLVYIKAGDKTKLGE